MLSDKPTKASTRRGGKPALTRQDWLQAAREALIKNGIEETKIDLLSKKMNMTRGSFYYHFEDRPELLRALLQHWEDTNNTPMLAAIEAAAARGCPDDFGEIIDQLWMDDTRYSPAFDSAVRDWARSDKKVAAAVHRVDDSRIEAFRQMFEAYGYSGDMALVRARVTYFHQVGYYALKIRESDEERYRLAPLYDEVLLK